MYLSRKIQGIEPYQAGEQPRKGTMVKLNTNENPFPPSPAVAEAIAKELSCLNLYPEIQGETLAAAIAKREGLSPEMVFVGNGSDEVLSLCFPAFFDPDAPILIPEITYSFYPVYAELFSIPCKKVPMSGEDKLDIDVDALLQPSGGVIFANPNAPTGRKLTIADIRRVAQATKAQGRVFVLDEAYFAFGAGSAKELLHEFDNLLITRTMSKDHSLAGLRVGYALGHPALIDGLRRAKDSFNSYPLDRLAIVGATAALNDEAYFKKTIREVMRVRDAFTKDLQALGFAVTPSYTNFVFARHPLVKGETLFTLLRARGFLVRRFAKPGIEDFLRITIGTSEQMTALRDAIAAILKEETI